MKISPHHMKVGKRLIFCIILFITLIPARSLVILLSIIQFAYVAFTGKRQIYLLNISQFVSQYITSTLGYVLFMSDVLPYPFNRFD